MISRAGILTLLFLIVSVANATDKNKENGSKKESGLFVALEDKLELKLGEYTNAITGWLAKFNDEHLGNSEIGKFFHYNEIKPKVEVAGTQGRNMKKLSLALIPLIFHVGATSTWMLVTAILAAKSVAIGMALLIFKIAVSSAKVSSFFTLLKAKHWHPHYEYTPHYEHHHGHVRSLGDLEHHPTYLEHPSSHDDTSGSYNTYNPQWTPSEKSSASYKQSVDPYTEYAASESKKMEKVYRKN